MTISTLVLVRLPIVGKLYSSTFLRFRCQGLFTFLYVSLPNNITGQFHGYVCCTHLAGELLPADGGQTFFVFVDRSRYCRVRTLLTCTNSPISSHFVVFKRDTNWRPFSCSALGSVVTISPIISVVEVGSFSFTTTTGVGIVAEIWARSL